MVTFFSVYCVTESGIQLSHRKGKLPMLPMSIQMCVCLGLVLRLQRKAKVWGTLWPEIDILCSPAPLNSPLPTAPRPNNPPAASATHRQQFEQQNKRRKKKYRKKTGSRHFLFLSLAITDGQKGGWWPKRGGGGQKGGYSNNNEREAHTQSSTNSHSK